MYQKEGDKIRETARITLNASAKKIISNTYKPLILIDTDLPDGTDALQDHQIKGYGNL